jgi:hypothetical protein
LPTSRRKKGAHRVDRTRKNDLIARPDRVGLLGEEFGFAYVDGKVCVSASFAALPTADSSLVCWIPA